MGKISDTSKYPIVAPEPTDIIIGTDVGSSDATKNFTAQSIADLSGASTAYSLSNTGSNSGLILNLAGGSPATNVTISPGSGLNFTSSSATSITMNLDVPVTTANGGTGLTAIGSADQVLKVNAGGTALEWGTIPSGGSPGVSARQGK